MEVIKETTRETIEIPAFISENAKRKRREYKLNQMKEQAVQKERDRVKRIKARRKVKLVLILLFLFAFIGIGSIAKYGVNKIQNKIEAMPVKVNAPEGYAKVYKTYTFHYGDTFDGLIYEILSENPDLKESYRFQDYKEEVKKINSSIVHNVSVIKSGTTIVYPVFEEIEEE